MHSRKSCPSRQHLWPRCGAITGHRDGLAHPWRLRLPLPIWTRCGGLWHSCPHRVIMTACIMVISACSDAVLPLWLLEWSFKPKSRSTVRTSPIAPIQKAGQASSCPMVCHLCPLSVQLLDLYLAAPCSMCEGLTFMVEQIIAVGLNCCRTSANQEKAHINQVMVILRACLTDWHDLIQMEMVWSIDLLVTHTERMSDHLRGPRQSQSLRHITMSCEPWSASPAARVERVRPDYLAERTEL